jgi:hypothetical protein
VYLAAARADLTGLCLDGVPGLAGGVFGCGDAAFASGRDDLTLADGDVSAPLFPNLDRFEDGISSDMWTPTGVCERYLRHEPRHVTHLSGGAESPKPVACLGSNGLVGAVSRAVCCRPPPLRNAPPLTWTVWQRADVAQDLTTSPSHSLLLFLSATRTATNNGHSTDLHFIEPRSFAETVAVALPRLRQLLATCRIYLTYQDRSVRTSNIHGRDCTGVKKS